MALLDLNDALWRTGFNLFDSVSNPSRKLKQRLRMRSGLSLKHGWPAFVPGFTNLGIKLHRAKKIHSELARSLLRPTARKDINLVLAVGADKVAHVLDDTGNVHFHLAEHLDGFARVLEGDVRRRGDD